MDEEKTLVSLAQKGDSQAFENLYRKYIKMIYGYVFGKTGKKEEAEDLTSEIWLAALRSLAKFAAASSFKNWLFGIAKHKIMDFYQEKYKIERMPLLEEIFLEEGENENNEGSDKEKELAALLGRLPENYRQILRLRFLKGLTSAEIAKETGLTVANVKVIQYRALKKAGEFKI